MHSECEDVTFNHIFDSAQIEFSDGSTLTLSEESDLAQYGVTIDSALATLKIDPDDGGERADDQAPALVSLTVTVRNGISSDTDWYNLSILVVSYESPVEVIIEELEECLPTQAQFKTSNLFKVYELGDDAPKLFLPKVTEM